MGCIVNQLKVAEETIMKPFSIMLGMSLILILNGCGGDTGGGDTNTTTANHAPVAEQQDVATNEDTAKAITLAGIDADGDTLAYTIVTNPAHGTLSGTAPNVTYTPNANYNGADSFTFKVNDGTTDSTAATVSITVSAVNDTFTASGVGVIVDVNESTVSTNWLEKSLASDPDGDTLTAIVTTNGSYGTFSIEGDTLTYHKTVETTSIDQGTMTISDGEYSVLVPIVAIGLYWKKIAAGKLHTLAIKSDGTLWAWGKNDYGQLGNGMTADCPDPVQIGTATNWQDVSAGDYHSIALTTEGALWAWGYNYYGQLGSGDYASKTIPEQEGSHGDWTHISAGRYHTAGIKSDGTLWTWGDNHHGQLGNDSTTKSNVPVQENSHGTWAHVSAGASHTMAIKSDDTLWAWGWNFYGQLGDNSTTDRHVPAQENTGSLWCCVNAGSGHTAAIKNDGTLWSWGINHRGQLGDGSNVFSKKTPAQESTGSDSWMSISVGNDFTIATQTNGSLWGWGINTYGQIGDGTTKHGLVPHQESWTDSDWDKISAGGNHATALKQDGTLWSWGDNGFGQLGDGNTTIRHIPVQRPSTTAWGMVSVGKNFVVALKQNFTVWSWGCNDYGQLGDGTTTMSNDPVQESTHGTDWRFVSAGDEHAVAIKDINTIWSWGYNGSGRLGNHSSANSSVPVQENSHSTWSTASAGAKHTAAIKSSDKTVWSWGYNYFGQLGDGSTSSSNVPQAESSGANHSMVSAGGSHTMAIRGNIPSTIFGTGSNSFGQLGDNTTTNRSSYTQEDTHATWRGISAGGGHTLAIDNGDGLYAWGRNTSGQLGDGATTNRKRAYQVGLSADWRTAAAGYAHSLAIKTNNTLYAWGNNERGQLGIGSIDAAIKIPTLVALDNVESVAAGRYRSAAIKGDGTLWEWGEIYLPTVVPTRSIVRH
jgi:alpha-tubulin suppressor-like RCC1 family protein